MSEHDPDSELPRQVVFELDTKGERLLDALMIAGIAAAFAAAWTGCLGVKGRPPEPGALIVVPIALLVALAAWASRRVILSQYHQPAMFLIRFVVLLVSVAWW